MSANLISKTTLVVGSIIMAPQLFGAESVYEVQRGDSLSQIAMDFAKEYPSLTWRQSLELIKELNAEKFDDVDYIRIGWKINLPDNDYVESYLAGMKNTGTVQVKPRVVAKAPGVAVTPLKVTKVDTDDSKKDYRVPNTSTDWKDKVSKLANKKTYMVQEGETLSEIALKFLGGKKLWNLNQGPMKELMALNPQIKSPDFILAGDTLVIPSRSVANDDVNVGAKPVKKKAKSQVHWSDEDRRNSLNPDFTFLKFEEKIQIDFIEGEKGLKFNIG
ncbi:MAG: LysM peptidoglycan-binding domain-containing protein [Bacteriovoracaceae bacterium]